MNKIMSTISKTFTKAKVKTVKHGPAIAITTGLIGMGVSVYFTYKAASKIDEAKKTRDDDFKFIDECEANGSIIKDDGTTDVYTEEDAKRDKKIHQSRYIVNVVKHTAAPVATFLLSAFLIAKGFHVEAKRLTAATTTIGALTSQITSIRESLVEKFGEEKANDIMLGKNKVILTDVSDDGEITTTEKTTTNRYVSGYTFEFSKESAPETFNERNEQLNRAFIEGNLRHAKYLLEEKQGHITFNDILDSFDIKRVGYGFTDGSIDTDGYTLVFDIDERAVDGSAPYYIITVNLQGFIANKI